MATRCPKCGKNNYGEQSKCSFCGSPLKFTPGEEIPEIKEEDVQAKIKQVKAKRLRNPVHIGVGIAVIVAGLLISLVVFLFVMFFLFTPASITHSYSSGAVQYAIPGGEEVIFGEITKEVTVAKSNWPPGSNHGYENHTAYEIAGDGEDDRAELNDPDLWIYSESDLGAPGDRVMVRLEAKENEFRETRAVVVDEMGTGLLSGWMYLVPGILIMIGGAAFLTYALIGKADTSLERLLEDDREFRKQQLAMMQAARKAAMEKQKQSTWSAGYPQTAQLEAPPSQGAYMETTVVAQPVAAEPSSVQDDRMMPLVVETAPTSSDQAPRMEADVPADTDQGQVRE